MTANHKTDCDNAMWQHLAENLIATLRALYPGATRAELVAASALDNLSAAEKEAALPAGGRRALAQYLDNLPHYRQGNREAALCEHQFRAMQIPTLLAASANKVGRTVSGNEQ